MQKTPSGETVIIPRNFKLLEELEKSEKGHGDMSISFGLVDSGDTFLSDWNGGILGPAGVSIVVHSHSCVSIGPWISKLNSCHELTVCLFVYLFIPMAPTILTTKTHHDGRFYQLRIHCTDSYPATPPDVRFVSKINMNCVDARTGAVKTDKLPAIRNWNRNMGIEQILQSIRMEMCSDQNRRLRQPAEGATF